MAIQHVRDDDLSRQISSLGTGNTGTISSPPKWECDVFVSFKRGGLVDIFRRDLFKRLDQVGIRYFRDDNREEAGEDFKRLDQQVRFALVVFCESYVNCNRCLDGLAELIRLRRGRNLVVIPIYFLRDVAGKFTEALESTHGSASVEKKNEWKDAVREAVKIPGYVLRAADDDKVIDKIVERFVNEIHSLYHQKEFEFGPFGVKDPILWHSSGINKVIHVVYNNDGIKSIDFPVEDGGSGKNRTYETVRFEDGEYITSFGGYIHDQRIRSLEFRTNKRCTLGPFGKMEGKYFSVPSKGGKVTHFFWGENEGKILTSIGARVEQGSEKFRPVIVQRVGLIGKRSRYKWDDDGHHHPNVGKIIGKSDSKSGEVQSIKFESGESETDRKLWPLEIPVGPDEYLTSITGVWDEEAGIKYLEFRNGDKWTKDIGVKNKSDQEKEKTIVIPDGGKIVGFYGWSRGSLCGIGAYFEREPIQRGVPWDDNEFFGVREIHLWLDETNSIRSIRFVYDNGSEEGEKVDHGEVTTRVERKIQVKLDYPREYLTSISGCTREDDAIKSLTFHSNRKHYPSRSIGEDGRFFWYPSAGSRVTGFYGTFDNNALQSIGVYAEAIPHIYPLKTFGPYGGLEGDDWNDGVHTDVRAFRVSYDDQGIQSISFMYDDYGSLVEGRQHGGGNAGKWIWLDFPDERLSSITVWKVKKEKETIISHLKITTTVDNYGFPSMLREKPDKDEIKLAGDSNENNLCYNRVGFFGRAGESYLNAIGAHFESN